MLYCIVLYCIVLYCIVLYCIVLYCIVLYLCCFLYTDLQTMSTIYSSPPLGPIYSFFSTPSVLLAYTLCFSPFSPFAIVFLCGVAGLADTFPSFPVSDSFLPDVPGFQVPPDNIFPPPRRSSSIGRFPPSSFLQLIGCFMFHLFF